MTDASISARKLDLGRVVRDTIAVLKKQAPLMFGASALLYLPVYLGSVLYTQSMMKASTSGDPTAALHVAASPFYWLLVLLGIFLGSFMYGFQLSLSIGELEGRPPTGQEAIQVGLKRCLPVFAASILFGLGVALGAVLLIVPGIILGIMWSVTLPAIVERGEVFAGFGHSRNLTRGNRWRIFGLLVATVIVMGVVQSILTALAGGSIVNTGQPPLTALVVIAIYSAAVAAIFMALLGALYVQLRELKGGGGESVAQVFS
jgi:hypothetical protein